MIAIDTDDPLAKELHDISDVEEKLPGYVSGIREWFRWYKTPDDKPLNGFGFEEKALGKVRIDPGSIKLRNCVGAPMYPTYFMETYRCSSEQRMDSE